MRWIHREAMLIASLLAAVGFGLLAAPGASSVGTILLAVAAAAMLISPPPASSDDDTLVVPRWLERVVFGVVLAFGAVARMWDLDGIPWGIVQDEGAFGRFARDVLQGDGAYLFGTVWFGDPAVYVYLLAPFVAVLGSTMQAIRLPSALAGVATLVVVYALFRSMFGRAVALVTLALLATSFVHVHFSRLALNVVFVGLCFSVGYLALWRAARHGATGWWVAAGVAFASAWYFHHGGRLSAPMLALALPLALAGSTAATRVRVRGAAYCIGAFFVTLAPLLVYLVGHWDEFVVPSSGKLIWDDWARAGAIHRLSHPLAILGGHALATIRMFGLDRDRALFLQFSPEPFVSPLVAPFVILGIAWALRRLDDLRFQLLAIWILTVTIVASVLVVEPRGFHRVFAAIIPTIGVGSVVLVMLAERCRAGFGSTGGWIAMVIVSILVLMVGGRGAIAYVNDTVSRAPWHEGTIPARAFAAATESTDRVFGMDSNKRLEYEPVWYLDPRPGLRPLADASTELVPTPDRPMLIILAPSYEMYPRLIRTLFPGVEERDHRRPDGQLLMREYRIPPGSTSRWGDETAGLKFEMRSASGALAASGIDRVLATSTLGRRVPAGALPSHVVWRGYIVPPVGGRYEFEMELNPITTAPELMIDGVAVALSRSPTTRARSFAWNVVLDASPHHIEIRHVATQADETVELRWTPPGSPREIVPPSGLRHD